MKVARLNTPPGIVHAHRDALPSVSESLESRLEARLEARLAENYRDAGRGARAGRPGRRGHDAAHGESKDSCPRAMTPTRSA